eukprot:2699291-Rhodomonas_salina.2
MQRCPHGAMANLCAMIHRCGLVTKREFSIVKTARGVCFGAWPSGSQCCTVRGSQFQVTRGMRPLLNALKLTRFSALQELGCEVYARIPDLALLCIRPRVDGIRTIPTPGRNRILRFHGPVPHLRLCPRQGRACSSTESRSPQGQDIIEGETE